MIWPGTGGKPESIRMQENLVSRRDAPQEPASLARYHGIPLQGMHLSGSGRMASHATSRAAGQAA
jgi:hypothetical protein